MLNRQSLSIMAVGLVLAGLAAPALAQDEAPRLHSGAVELGLNGSLVSVEGSSTARFGALAGTFFNLFTGLGGIELETAYSHISSLDVFDLGAYLDWQFPVGKTALYPFVAIGGGLRYEAIGSFEATRYPVGLLLGFKLLASRTVALRVDYRFNRILADPVADFDEHELRFGVSLFLNNK
jgi:hypothetical protein